MNRHETRALAARARELNPLEALADAATRNPERAVAIARKAKAAGQSHPLIHRVIAAHLKQQGQYETAITEAGLGLEKAPQDPQLLMLVGFCLIELGRERQAARVFEAAMKADPASAEASYGYGWVAERIGALEAAESAFKRALSLNPNHADALAGLSGLAVRRRDWGDARVFAERAASLSSHQTDALMNLARVELGELEFEAAEKRLRATIALPFIIPRARANAYILLGDALDGQKRYREALDAYGQGKSDLRQQYATLFVPAQSDAPARVLSAADIVDDMVAEFRQTPPEEWARPSRSDPSQGPRSPVFVLGFPRSGTTLLEQVLATHPEIDSLGERPLLAEAEAEFLSGSGGIKRLSGVVPDLLTPFREAYWRNARQFGGDPVAKLLIDKHPLHTGRLPLIAKVFPGSKIIFTIRDPRDVVLSCFRRSFNMNASTYEFNTLDGAARYYDAVMRAGETYLETLTLDVFRLRYEDLVRDFQANTDALCDFLGVERVDLTGFAQTAAGRAITTPSSTQVTRSLYGEGVDQWRRYAFALEPVTPILAPWIEKFGYSTH